MARKKRVIAVVGATGSQGGGLVRAILEDKTGGFAARAITRSRQGAKATELAELGAEVVFADVDDAASIADAFRGAEGAYCVTFYWAHFSPEKELAEARGMAQAAKSSGVRHVIWSTLEDTRKWVPVEDPRMPTLMGKYKVPHFDAKGEANEAFSKAGVPTTFLLTSFYWDNFINFGMGPRPRKEDGVLELALPMGDKRLPGIAADDIGRCAYGVFKRGKEFIGKTVGIMGEALTGGEMAAAMTEALGREVRYRDISPEQYRALGFPGAEDLGNMFQFKRDFNEYFCGARSTELARELNPKLQDFRGWLQRNAARIPLE